HPERACRQHQLPRSSPAPVPRRGTVPRCHRGRPAHGRCRHRPHHPTAPDHPARPAPATGQLTNCRTPVPGANPLGPAAPWLTPPHSRRTPTSIKGVTMGIIAWIILGLGAGLLANLLIPGRRQQGLILTCLIGIIGALGGGWAATKIFHVHTLHGFFNVSTWLTAIVGAAILLLAYHLVTRDSGRSRTRSRRYARR